MKPTRPGSLGNVSLIKHSKDPSLDFLYTMHPSRSIQHSTMCDQMPQCLAIYVAVRPMAMYYCRTLLHQWHQCEDLYTDQTLSATYMQREQENHKTSPCSSALPLLLSRHDCNTVQLTGFVAMAIA
jgi:hypothetical protein